MDDDDLDDTPPFWLHPSASASPSALRRTRSTTSSSSTSTILLLILFLLAAATLAIIFLQLPKSYSSSPVAQQGPNPRPSPKPHSIKKGWDSLNLVLVLFAIICGFLTRTGDGGNDGAGSVAGASPVKSTVTPRTPYRSGHYYGGGGYLEENRYGGYSRSSSFNGTPTMRSSFSYPDLRQESAWNSYDIDRRRFYDDTSVDHRGYVDGEQIHRRSVSRVWRDESRVEEVKDVVEDVAAEQIHGRLSRVWRDDSRVEEVKDVVEDVAAVVSAKVSEQVKDAEEPQPQSHPQPEPSLPLPIPPSPTPVLPAVESRRKHRRRMSYEAIPRSWKDNDSGDEVMGRRLSMQPPPPPPPPPAMRRRGSSEEKISDRNGKKRGGSGSGSATKEFFQSLGKKRKQRQKSIENLEALLGHTSSSGRPRLTLSPPPPSPPPSSHSVLQNLFSSKKSRNRGRRTAPHSSPPPSPPPRRTTEIRKSKRPTNPEPPLHSTMIEEGNRSPLIHIPPAPPPPPPFRVPDWKFMVVHRDYVRIKSREPSVTDTPDVTENEDDRSPMVSEGSQSPMSSPMSSATTKATTKGEEEKGMMFCPSPDVDTKADKFIARFREGLKLEKMNSWNQRQGTVTVRSNLGPSSDQ